MPDFTEINYNPGISGFVKGHRHFEGPALIMSVWVDDNQDWAGVYWVKRLHHKASPIGLNQFAIQNSRTQKAVERAYDILMAYGPPYEAYLDPEPDLQRKHVYVWEEDNIFPGHKELTWKECQTFVSSVWREVGTGPEPELILNRRSRYPFAFGGRICLPDCDRPFNWRKPVLLHEIAHELRFMDKHGPEFVAQYIDLCVRFLGLNRDILRSSATRYGVSFKP